MAIPNQRSDLESFGYKPLDEGFCRGCRAAIEWWLTPNGHKMPFGVHVKDGVETLMPHHAECPNVDQFRRPKQN